MPNRREREFRKRNRPLIDWHPSIYSGGSIQSQLHAREQWAALLKEGDPAKEREARRLAEQAGIPQVQIDHLHAVHFKPKSSQPVPAAQPPAEQSPQIIGHPAAEKSLDERNERKSTAGSFKGKCQH